MNRIRDTQLSKWITPIIENGFPERLFHPTKVTLPLPLKPIVLVDIDVIKDGVSGAKVLVKNFTTDEDLFRESTSSIGSKSVKSEWVKKNESKGLALELTGEQLRRLPHELSLSVLVNSYENKEITDAPLSRTLGSMDDGCDDATPDFSARENGYSIVFEWKTSLGKNLASQSNEASRKYLEGLQNRMVLNKEKGVYVWMSISKEAFETNIPLVTGEWEETLTKAYVMLQIGDLIQTKCRQKGIRFATEESDREEMLDRLRAKIADSNSRNRLPHLRSVINIKPAMPLITSAHLNKWNNFKYDQNWFRQRGMEIIEDAKEKKKQDSIPKIPEKIIGEFHEARKKTLKARWGNDAVFSRMVKKLGYAFLVPKEACVAKKDEFQSVEIKEDKENREIKKIKDFCRDKLTELRKLGTIDSRIERMRVSIFEEVSNDNSSRRSDFTEADTEDILLQDTIIKGIQNMHSIRGKYFKQRDSSEEFKEAENAEEEWTPEFRKEKTEKNQSTVDLRLDDEDKVRIGSVGWGGKKYKNHPRLKSIRNFKERQMHPDIFTDDFEEFAMSTGKELLRSNLSQYVGFNRGFAPSKELLNYATIHHDDKKDHESQFSTMDTIMNSRLFQGLSIHSLITHEMNLALNQFTSSQSEAVLKRITKGLYGLFKTSGPNRHVNCILIAKSKYYDNLGEPFATPLITGKYMIFKPFSMNKHRISHFLSADIRMAGALMTWAEIFKQEIDPKNLTAKNFSDEVVDHFMINFLTYMDASKAVSTELQLVRYAYMEAIRMSSDKVNPLKVLEKFDMNPRRRFHIWCQKRIIKAFTMMTLTPPTVVYEESQNTEEKAFEECRNLLSWVTLKPIKYFSSAVSLSYMGYFHNKDENEEMHGFLKIYNKIIKEEILMREVRLKYTGLESPKDIKDLRDHEFDYKWVMSCGTIVRQALDRKYSGAWETKLNKRISDEFFFKTAEDIATTKSTALKPKTDTIDPNLTEEDAKKEKRTTRLMGGIMDLLSGPNPKISERPMYDVPDLLEEIEREKGLTVTNFMKNQIGGAREIFILSAESRIVVLFAEIVARIIDEELPMEMLTKGDQKIAKSNAHFANVAREKNKMEKIEKEAIEEETIISSDDATTWCQRFIMPVFACLMKSIVPDWIFQFLCRIYNVATLKRIILPEKLLELIKRRSEIKSADKSFNEMKSQFLGTPHPVYGFDLIEPMSRVLKNRSNFMQGIFHYTSSCAHAIHLWGLKTVILMFFPSMVVKLYQDVMQESYKQEYLRWILRKKNEKILSLIKKDKKLKSNNNNEEEETHYDLDSLREEKGVWTSPEGIVDKNGNILIRAEELTETNYNLYLRDEAIKVFVTVKVSSDDSSMIMTCVYNSMIFTQKMIKYALDIFSRTKDVSYGLMTMLKSEPKSTSHCFNGIEEFNSYWYLHNTLMMPIIKFTLASLIVKVVTKMDDRQYIAAGLRQQCVENGVSSYLVSFHEKLQGFLHYEALGSCTNRSFLSYKKTILDCPHPTLGFFLCEPAETCGCLGLDYCMWDWFKNEERSSGVENWFMENSTLEMNQYGRSSVAINILLGKGEKWKAFNEEIQKKFGYKLLEFAESDPSMLFRKAKDVKESMFWIAKKSNNPSTSEAFSFLSTNRLYTTGIYILTKPCITYWNRVEYKKEKAQLELLGKDTNLNSNYVLGRKKKVSLLRMIIIAKEESSKFKKLSDEQMRILFPNYGSYEIIKETLRKVYESNVRYVRTNVVKPKRIINMSLEKHTSLATVDLVEVIKRKWSLGKAKLPRFNFENSWNSYVKVFPWLKPSLKETLDQKIFEDVISLSDFIKLVKNNYRTVKPLAPMRAQSGFQENYKTLILQNRYFMMEPIGKESIDIVTENKRFNDIYSKISKILVCPMGIQERIDLMQSNLLSHYKGYISTPQDASRLLAETTNLERFLLSWWLFESGTFPIQDTIQLVTNVNFGSWVYYIQEQVKDEATNSYVGEGQIGIVTDNENFKIKVYNDKIIYISCKNTDKIRENMDFLKKQMERKLLSKKGMNFKTAKAAEILERGLDANGLSTSTFHVDHDDIIYKINSRSFEYSRDYIIPTLISWNINTNSIEPWKEGNILINQDDDLRKDRSNIKVLSVAIEIDDVNEAIKLCAYVCSQRNFEIIRDYAFRNKGSNFEDIVLNFKTKGLVIKNTISRMFINYNMLTESIPYIESKLVGPKGELWLQNKRLEPQKAFLFLQYYIDKLNKSLLDSKISYKEIRGMEMRQLSTFLITEKKLEKEKRKELISSYRSMRIIKEMIARRYSFVYGNYFEGLILPESTDDDSALLEPTDVKLPDQFLMTDMITSTDLDDLMKAEEMEGTFADIINMNEDLFEKENEIVKEKILEEKLGKSEDDNTLTETERLLNQSERMDNMVRDMASMMKAIDEDQIEEQYKPRSENKRIVLDKRSLLNSITILDNYFKVFGPDNNNELRLLIGSKYKFNRERLTPAEDKFMEPLLFYFDDDQKEKRTNSSDKKIIEMLDKEAENLKKEIYGEELSKLELQDKKKRFAEVRYERASRSKQVETESLRNKLYSLTESKDIDQSTKEKIIAILKEDLRRTEFEDEESQREEEYVPEHWDQTFDEDSAKHFENLID